MTGKLKLACASAALDQCNEAFPHSSALSFITFSFVNHYILGLLKFSANSILSGSKEGSHCWFFC